MMGVVCGPLNRFEKIDQKKKKVLIWFLIQMDWCKCMVLEFSSFLSLCHCYVAGVSG